MIDLTEYDTPSTPTKMIDLTEYDTPTKAPVSKKKPSYPNEPIEDESILGNLFGSAAEHKANAPEFDEAWGLPGEVFKQALSGKDAPESLYDSPALAGIVSAVRRPVELAAPFVGKQILSNQSPNPTYKESVVATLPLSLAQGFGEMAMGTATGGPVGGGAAAATGDLMTQAKVYRQRQMAKGLPDPGFDEAIAAVGGDLSKLGRAAVVGATGGLAAKFGGDLAGEFASVAKPLLDQGRGITGAALKYIGKGLAADTAAGATATGTQYLNDYAETGEVPTVRQALTDLAINTAGSLGGSAVGAAHGLRKASSEGMFTETTRPTTERLESLEKDLNEEAELARVGSNLLPAPEDVETSIKQVAETALPNRSESLGAMARERAVAASSLLKEHTAVDGTIDPAIKADADRLFQESRTLTEEADRVNDDLRLVSLQERVATPGDQFIAQGNAARRAVAGLPSKSPHGVEVNTEGAIVPRVEADTRDWSRRYAGDQSEIPVVQDPSDPALTGRYPSVIRKDIYSPASKPGFIADEQGNVADVEGYSGLVPARQSDLQVPRPSDLNAAEKRKVAGLKMNVSRQDRGFVSLGPKPEPPMSPAEQRQFDKIHMGGQPKREGALMGRLDNVIASIFDDQHAIVRVTNLANKALGTKLAPTKNPALLARNLKGQAAFIADAMDNGVPSFDGGTRVTRGLIPILKEIPGGQQNRFRAYMRSRHDVHTIESRGIKTGANLADAKAVVVQGRGSAFEKTFNELRDYQHALLRYGAESGIISKKSLANMVKNNPDYIPLRRLMDPDEIASESFGTGKSMESAGELFHKLEGSDRDILDPIQSIVENTAAIITAGRKNEFMTALADLSKVKGMDRYIKRINNPPETAANTVRVKRGGEVEHYRVDQDILEVVKGLDETSQGILGKILSVPANTLRGGQTLDPGFGMANLIRDSMQAAIVSRSGLAPLIPQIKAMLSYSTKGGRKQIAGVKSDLNAAGGGQSIESGYYYNQDAIGAAARKAGLKGMGLNDINPIRGLAQIAMFSEELTRMAEYQTAYKYAKTKLGYSEKDAAYHAAFESRDLMDFGMRGKHTKHLKGVAAFFGSQLSGLYREMKAGKQAKTWVKGVSLLTVPTIANFIINSENDEYLGAPQWRRDTQIYIGGRWLPKPPGILGQVFMTIPERMMMAWYKKDPQAWKGLPSTLASNVFPNPIPTGLRTAAEAAGNYSFYQEQPIVPAHLAKQDPEFQYDEKTSKAARVAGTALGVSPMKMDYLRQGTFGTLGKRVALGFKTPLGGFPGVDDLISPPEDFVPQEKEGLLSRFQEKPEAYGSEPISRFYDKLDRLEKDAFRAKANGLDSQSSEFELDSMSDAKETLSNLRAQMKVEPDPEARASLRAQMAEIASQWVATPEGLPQLIRKRVAGLSN